MMKMKMKMKQSRRNRHLHAGSFAVACWWSPPLSPSYSSSGPVRNNKQKKNVLLKAVTRAVGNAEEVAEGDAGVKN
jgi:hypothetical protein